MKKLILFMSLLTALLASCESGSKLYTPVSSGRPYEILVVVDRDFWNNPNGNALKEVLKSDVPGLAQPEPSFRVSTCDMAHFDRTFKIFRNIIVVDINPDLYTQTKLKFVRDVNAAPQMIMTIQSPSRSEFSDFVYSNGQTIIDFFVKTEFNREINLLEKKHENNAEKTVKEMFGCTVWLPSDMNAMKKGQDFLWVSSPSKNSMNFCIYSYPYTNANIFTPEYFMHKRDSVMKKNIPGSEEGSYMSTFKDFIQSKHITVRHAFAQEVRGLWEMEGDFMGGPYVSHVRVDTVNQKVIVAEGFVFLPNEKKRDLIHRLEASLYTLQLPAEKGGELDVTGVEETDAVDERIKNKSKDK